uniref:VQ domain-containing protein n=1 Tax=Tanacetum cinerariifolium TaxID=118510 RepID=A0A6L2K051_TANCI|nr:hypothetical protein [Tanacetum cinerariifolium]
MNSYKFMGLDDVEEGEEISSRKKNFIKRVIADIKTSYHRILLPLITISCAVKLSCSLASFLLFSDTKLLRAPRQYLEPQVYDINKNDFRNMVQQLKCSPSHHSQEPLLHRPTYNAIKSPSMRLQCILAPINLNRPRMMELPKTQPQAPDESPISAYMRYLQHFINDPASLRTSTNSTSD